MTDSTAPAPKRGRGRPAIGRRVTVPLPDALHEELRAAAAERHTSIADEIRRRITREACGCRCDDCTAEKAAAVRARRAKREQGSRSP